MHILRYIFNVNRSRIQFIALTSAFPILVSAFFLLVASFILPEHFNGHGGIPAYGVSRFLITTLILAPIIENSILIGLVEIIEIYSNNNFRITMIVGLFAAILHGLANGWAFISGFFLFSTMAYSYLINLHDGFQKRFAIIYLQHFLFNTPTCLYYLMSR